MSRRALPKLDPALDLAQHLVLFDQLPRPFTSVALFGRQAPLEVEIGSGKGLFLSAAASENAAHDFLGIEVATKYARYTASRLAKRELSNARLIHGDACRLFNELIAENSLAAVHVYFPDPWWKARHKKRRVMNESMVRLIERVLIPDGTLHFWTDVEEYFQTTLALVATHTHLTGPHEVQEKPADHDLDYRTHFERRKRQSGLPIYRAEFRKPLAA
jgi:tRNA (guanine-N7-)-methyltransferase